MAVTPKGGQGKAPAKRGSSTLSASEALKAAEAAITPPVAKKPVGRKPAEPKATPPKVETPKTITPKAAAPKAAASVKPIDIKPQAASAKPIDPNPQATAKSSPSKTTEVKPIDTNPQAKAAKPDPIVEPVVKTPSVAAKPLVEKTVPLPVLEGTKKMTDLIETGKKFAEDAKAKMETVYADFNEKAKAGVEKSTKAIEELSDLTKGNVEALVESGKIAAKGIETMGQEAVDYSRKNFEKATASFKSFSTVKTPTEFFQLQSQLMSSSFDEFAKEAAKNSEAFMKLAGDVAQPLTARVTLVTDKVKSLAA
jgi:hypothetical protein